MLSFIVKTLVCSGLFYGLYHLLLRKETFFQLNRLFLLATLLLSALIPFFQITINIPSAAPDTFFYSLVKGTKDFFFVYLLDEVIVYGKASPLSWQNILEKIYIVGIGVFSIRIFIFLFQIVKLNWKSKKYKAKTVCLYVHNQPYTVFSFANIIYVNKQELQSDYFKVIWKHEVQHINYGHTYESFLLEVFCCLFWFNPFVWAMKRRLKELHEYQVDNRLVEQGMDTVVYQQHLVNYTLDGDTLVAANNFAAMALKNRIKMLSKHQSSVWRKTRFSIIIPIVAVLLFAFSVDSTTQEPNTINLPINNSINPTDSIIKAGIR